MSKGSKRRKEDTSKEEVKPEPRDIKDLYLNDKSL